MIGVPVDSDPEHLCRTYVSERLDRLILIGVVRDAPNSGCPETTYTKEVRTMADFIDKAQHKAEELAGTAKEKAGEATGDDSLRAEGAKDQAKANTHQAADKVSDAAESVADSAAGAAKEAKHAASDVAEKASDVAEDVKDAVKDKVGNVDVDDVKEKASQVADKAADKASAVADDVKNTVRNIDSDDVAQAAKVGTPVIAAIAAAAGAVAFVLIRRRNRRRSAAHLFVPSKRTTRKLAKKARKHSF